MTRTLVWPVLLWTVAAIAICAVMIGCAHMGPKFGDCPLPSMALPELALFACAKDRGEQVCTWVGTVNGRVCQETVAIDAKCEGKWKEVTDMTGCPADIEQKDYKGQRI